MPTDNTDPPIRRSSRSTKGQHSKLIGYEYEQEAESKPIQTTKTKPKSTKRSSSSTASASNNGSKNKKAKKSPSEPALQEEPEPEPESDHDSDPEVEEPAPVDDDSDDEFVGSDADADADADQDQDPEQETVRCLVCGATDENYDEETDQLGLMVECSKCQTWQHAKCLLGHKNPKKIPKDYLCNVCDPNRYPNLQLELSLEDYKNNKNQDMKNTKKESRSTKVVSRLKSKSKSKDNTTISSKNKIRLSVVKTFDTLFLKLLPNLKPALKNKNDELNQLAQSHAKQLEEAIFTNYSIPPNSSSPGQKYSEKSRSLYANLKDSKNILYKQVVEGTMTMNQLSLLSPQELLNPDLQKFSKQIMQQAIHDSVLKPIAKPTFRKTHKGDEVMENEDAVNDVVEASSGLVFTAAAANSTAANSSSGGGSPPLKQEQEEDSTSTQPTDLEDGNEEEEENTEAKTEVKRKTTSFVGLDDYDDYDERSDSGHQIDGNNNNALDDAGENKREYEDVGLDDELDDILNDKKPGSGSRSGSGSVEVVMDPQIWQGELTFPGICNFESKLKFLSSSVGTNHHHHHHDNQSTNNIKAEIEFSKKMMDSFQIKNYLEIEGRLNDERAIQYLTKILKTRPIIATQLSYTEHEQHEANYQRLFQYFNQRSKIGVIGNRPNFVKDCYLCTFNSGTTRDQPIWNTLFNSFKQNFWSDLPKDEDLILVFFVVKADDGLVISSSPAPAGMGPGLAVSSVSGNGHGAATTPQPPQPPPILKTLPNDFYKLNSTNQAKFMEIIQLNSQKGKKLSEFEIDNLVRNLLLGN